MKTIKKLGPCIEPYIEHLINSIIESENYPNIFKVSKITPTLKPDKSANLIDSYRPINNLSSFEKLVEQHLKNCIIDHLEANNIILSNHHGSLKHHSTTTALASINHHLNTHYHNNNTTALIQTDLSAAFDTVDHTILLQKLEHYGLRGKEYNIIKSFLSNRQQYVFIDGMESEVINSGNSSVCQGSKLSSLLYILYTNEIPLLHRLNGTEINDKMTDCDTSNDIKDIQQYCIQYMDDSTTMITTNDINNIKTYIDKFFITLEQYYKINKLTLNPDKTKFMIICKPSTRHLTKNIVLNTTDYVINQCDKVKILGIFISAGLSHLATINQIISKVNYRLNLLKKVFKYTKHRTSLMVMNSVIISVFKYACPIIIDANASLHKKLNTLLLRCSRVILGFESFKWNTTKIMKNLGWYTYQHTLMIESVSFIHKCIYENLPININNLLCYSLNRTQNLRNVRKVLIKEGTKSEKMSQTLIHRAVFLYNILPSEIKAFNPKKFKKYAAEHFLQNYANNNIPKNTT